MNPAEGFETLGRRSVVDLQFLDVTVRDVRTPRGDVVERIVIEHPGAVAVVPRIDDDVILIEQYREPMGGAVLEIPAGKLDTDPPDPEITAARELEEEIGYRPGRLTYLSEIWTAVGFTNERIHIYVGDQLVDGVRAPVGPEEVASRLVRMPFTDAVEAVVAGEIRDAKTVAGLLLAARHGPS